MNRDEQLLALRPQIPLILEDNKNEVEAFMHQTLRPILKFQHSTLIRCIKGAPHFKHLIFKLEREKKNRDTLKEFLQKNKLLKAQLIGVVIGLFSESELDCFEKNESELKKRIWEMAVTRFLSEL
ncbi:MAG: hypothetical protein ACI8YQ_001869 [Polaribacter sp.]|jgi:hypothetical protein